MAGITEQQKATLERRREKFRQFVEESFFVLTDFLTEVGCSDAASFVVDANRFVAPVDAWMCNFPITTENRVRYTTRIGYFIGELFSQRYEGRWLIDEDPDSPYFSHYVAGEFAALPNPTIEISPFAIANNYVNEPPQRSLVDALRRTEDGLKRLVRDEEGTRPVV